MASLRVTEPSCAIFSASSISVIIDQSPVFDMRENSSDKNKASERPKFDKRIDI